MNVDASTYVMVTDVDASTFMCGYIHIHITSFTCGCIHIHVTSFLCATRPIHMCMWMHHGEHI